ncbi:MAG: transposase [Flavobacteriales bacterium]|nr:transposase [Flavobacteriales bacterium]
MKLIQEIFEQSFESYGSPRMSVELSRRAYKVFRRRTARIESTRLTS